MPAQNPTLGSVHQSRPLDQMAIGGFNQNYELRDVFPVVPVDKEADSYYIWTAADILRNEAKKVRPNSKAPRGGFSMTTGSFELASYEFIWPIPVRVSMNADGAIRAEMRGAKRVGQKVGLAVEVDIASAIIGASWTGATTIAAGGGWASGARNPFDDVNTQKLGIWGKIFKPVNCMVMGYQVFMKLQTNPYVLERAGIPAWTGAGGPPQGGRGFVGPITRDHMAYLFDVERLIVSTAGQNTANQGQTASMSAIWDDDVFVCYRAADPAVDEPSAGYCFVHQSQGMGEVTVKTWRENDPEADCYKGQSMIQVKDTLLDAGALITDVND